MPFGFFHLTDGSLCCFRVGDVHADVREARVAELPAAEGVNFAALFMQCDRSAQADAGGPAGDDGDFFSHC